MTTDLELLDRWREGSRDAGHELFQRYYDSISRFFENKLSEDVDDLIQATFYALVKHAGQFRKQASFRTYLFTIAKNELYRYLRKRSRSGKVDLTVTSLEDLETSPPSRMIRAEGKVLLLEALRTLPVEQQLLIELHYWENISFEVLAEMFEIAPTTVRTRLFRARRVLMERMMRLSKEVAPPSSADNNLEAWARSLRSQWVGAGPAEE